MVVKQEDNTFPEVSRKPDISFMYKSSFLVMNWPNSVSALFRSLLTEFPCLSGIFVFIAPKVVSMPYVSGEERIFVRQMKEVKMIYRCVVKFGFMDKVKISRDLTNSILEQIRATDPEYYDQVIITNAKTILNIYEREFIHGKTSPKHANQGMFSPAYYARLLEGRIRFFCSLYSLQVTPSSIFDSKNDDRTILVGTEVEI